MCVCPGMCLYVYTCILAPHVEHFRRMCVVLGVCVCQPYFFLLLAVSWKLKGLKPFFAFAQPAHSAQPREPAMVFKVGDRVKRRGGGDEIGEVVNVYPDFVVVHIQGEFKATPPNEWEVAAQAETEVISYL